MSTVLVTGGAGFIGSHIADGYIRSGWNVIVVDNLTAGNREQVNPQAKFYRTSIGDSSLEEVFHNNNIDLVNHHAAQINVRASVANPSFDAEQNIKGTLNLIECALRSGVKNLIFSSSGGAIYGNPQLLPAKETSPKLPLSPYGVSKYSVELYLYFYRLARGLNYITLRYANVYGPRQDPKGEAGVIAIFSGEMNNGTIPAIFGTGQQTRDYVFVRDVVAANLLATSHLDRLKNQDISSPDDIAFNIGTGRQTSVNDLFNRLATLSGFRHPPRYMSARAGEVEQISLDPERARQILDWQPETSLDKGLRETVASFDKTVSTGQKP